MRAHSCPQEMPCTPYFPVTGTKIGALVCNYNELASIDPDNRKGPTIISNLYIQLYVTYVLSFSGASTANYYEKTWFIILRCPK